MQFKYIYTFFSPFEKLSKTLSTKTNISFGFSEILYKPPLPLLTEQIVLKLFLRRYFLLLRMVKMSQRVGYNYLGFVKSECRERLHFRFVHKVRVHRARARRVCIINEIICSIDRLTIFSKCRLNSYLNSA